MEGAAKMRSSLLKMNSETGSFPLMLVRQMVTLQQKVTWKLEPGCPVFWIGTLPGQGLSEGGLRLAPLSFLLLVAGRQALGLEGSQRTSSCSRHLASPLQLLPKRALCLLSSDLNSVALKGPLLGMTPAHFRHGHQPGQPGR